MAGLDPIVTCLVVAKEIVSWDTKSAIVSTVTCVSSWISEKQASRDILLSEHSDKEGHRA
jgi:hypothetical protein